MKAAEQRTGSDISHGNRKNIYNNPTERPSLSCAKLVTSSSSGLRFRKPPRGLQYGRPIRTVNPQRSSEVLPMPAIPRSESELVSMPAQARDSSALNRKSDPSPPGCKRVVSWPLRPSPVRRHWLAFRREPWCVCSPALPCTATCCNFLINGFHDWFHESGLSKPRPAQTGFFAYVFCILWLVQPRRFWTSPLDIINHAPTARRPGSDLPMH